MDRFYDNTRISSFRVCPRMFYYRHVRHWAFSFPSKSLVFGSSWHEAMDVVWGLLAKDKDISTADLGMLAFKAFMQNWLLNDMPDLDEMDEAYEKKLGAQHPMHAYEMILAYIDIRRDFLTSPDFELLEIELPFAVPLDPNQKELWYVGRLDKVFSHHGKVNVGEHKTTSEYKIDGPFRDSFIESFSPNSQVDGYLYAGKMKYGKVFDGVWVDAALVHRTNHESFKFIPVDRLDSQLEGWLWETHYQIQMIEANLSRLEDLNKKDKYMAAFPKNTSSCSMYGGCVYRDTCKMLTNPQQQIEPPDRFAESKWEPFQMLELHKIGFKED